MGQLIPTFLLPLSPASSCRSSQAASPPEHQAAPLHRGADVLRGRSAVVPLSRSAIRCRRRTLFGPLPASADPLTSLSPLRAEGLFRHAVAAQWHPGGEFRDFRNALPRAMGPTLRTIGAVLGLRELISRNSVLARHRQLDWLWSRHSTGRPVTRRLMPERPRR